MFKYIKSLRPSTILYLVICLLAIGYYTPFELVGQAIVVHFIPSLKVLLGGCVGGYVGLAIVIMIKPLEINYLEEYNRFGISSHSKKYLHSFSYEQLNIRNIKYWRLISPVTLVLMLLREFNHHFDKAFKYN